MLTSVFLKNVCKAKTNEIMWTTYKEFKEKLKGKGYTKGFVSLNARATNDFSNKSVLAYTVNRFLNPDIKMFFSYHNIKVDEELFALSELIQWIWRSRIRNEEPIQVYIPSRRMRSLLQQYLDNKL